jgi:hypothetical protein
MLKKRIAYVPLDENEVITSSTYYLSNVTQRDAWTKVPDEHYAYIGKRQKDISDTQYCQHYFKTEITTLCQ